MSQSEEQKLAEQVTQQLSALTIQGQRTPTIQNDEKQPIQHVNTSPEPVVANKPSPFVLRPKLADPPKFSGQYNENVVSFMERMTLYLAITKPPPDQWVAYTLMQLTDIASVWASQSILPKLVSPDMEVQKTCTWENFKTDIYQRFQPVEVNRQAREELAVLTQWTCKSQNSIQEYCSKFTSVIQRITDMSMADQIQHFIRGLKTKTREKVEDVDPQPTTLDQAMSLAVRKDVQVTRQIKNSSQLTNRRPSQPSRFSHHNNRSSSSTSVPMELGNMQSYDEEEESDTSSHEMSVQFMSGSGGSRPWYSGKLKDNPGLKERLIKDDRCLFCRTKGHKQEACQKFIEVKKKEQSKNW